MNGVEKLTDERYDLILYNGYYPFRESPQRGHLFAVLRLDARPRVQRPGKGEKILSEKD